MLRRQPVEEMSVKKPRLLLPVALVLVVAAWATACASQPISPTPYESPTTTLVAVGASSAVPEIPDAWAAVPTATPRYGGAELERTPAPTATQTELPDEVEGVVRLAKKDLAERLSIESDTISLASADAEEWSDTSLGCPRPGMMYAQVITPGYRVVLLAEGLMHEYHTDAGRLVVLCGGERPGREETRTMTETPVPSQGGLPIFVELTQATLLGSGDSPDTPIVGQPNTVFAYIANSRTLLLRSAITVEPTTEVLVGLSQVIQGPAGDLVMGRLFQVPASGTPALALVDLAVSDIERETGRLRLQYSGETLELSPGQSRTFKRALADQGSVEITVITNHGRLAEMGSLPGEHSGR